MHIHVLQFRVKNINLILNDTSNTLIEIIMNLYNFLHVSCVTLKIKGLFITLFSSLLNFISIFYNCDAIYKNNIIFIHFAVSLKMICFVLIAYIICLEEIIQMIKMKMCFYGNLEFSIQYTCKTYPLCFLRNLQ